MPDNYLKMEQQARDLFLKVDQQAMTDTWELEADEDFIYPVFFGQRLKIDRKTAEISAAPAAPEEGAGYFIPKSTVNDSLILFDILSRTGTAPKASGQWASISMLGGHIGAGHDRTLRNEPQAAYFAGQTEKLAEACRAAGGEPFSKADVGYALPVFRDLKILFHSQYLRISGYFSSSGMPTTNSPPASSISSTPTRLPSCITRRSGM